LELEVNHIDLRVRRSRKICKEAVNVITKVSSFLEKKNNWNENAKRNLLRGIAKPYIQEFKLYAGKAAGHYGRLLAVIIHAHKWEAEGKKKVLRYKKSKLDTFFGQLAGQINHLCFSYRGYKEANLYDFILASFQDGLAQRPWESQVGDEDEESE